MAYPRTVTTASTAIHHPRSRKKKKMKEMERITTNEWRGDRDSDSKYVIPKELPTAIVTVESRRRR